MKEEHTLEGLKTPTPPSAHEGQFLLQYCESCDRYQFYPRAICLECGGVDLTWRKALGRGTIYTFSVVHRAMPNASEYGLEPPYILSLVDLDEGVRVMSNIAVSDPEDVAIGDRVEMIDSDFGGQSGVPRFRLIAETSTASNRA